MSAEQLHPRQVSSLLESAPLVSVVIPTKNRANFLRGTIDSVLCQDYPHIQCIVADGGSTDGTIELLKSYGDRIEWFSEPDRGAFDAINKGWRQSCGSILAWLNADDEWVPGAVRVAVEYFQGHPEVSVVYGACGAIDERDLLIEVYPPRPWNLRDAVLNCDHIINQAASFMRRSILEKVDYLYPAWCHDHDLWLRIALAGGVFGTVPDVLANARIWPENLGNNPAIIIPGKVGLTKRFFKSPGLPGRLAKLKRRAISNAYLRCMYYISPRKLSNWPLSLKVFWRAVLADPFNLPHLTQQVISIGVPGLPVVGPLVRLFLGLMRTVKRLAGRVKRTLVGVNKALLRLIVTVGPLGIVAGAGAIAVLSNPPSVQSGAAIFFYVSTPLILLLALQEIRNRK